MPDTKISAMTNGGAAQATDNIPAVRAGANVRVQVAAVAGSGAYSDLTGAPTLATVATTGAYDDLTGKPTLGTAAATDATAYATAAQGTKADSAVQPTIVDAKGDLLVGSAADTLARLAAGTNTYVLTADSAEATGLKWAAPSGGGGLPSGMTYTSPVTTTGQAVLDIAGTFNGSGQTLTGLRFNATDTTSAAGSWLLELLVGGSAKFAIKKSGEIFSLGGRYVPNAMSDLGTSLYTADGLWTFYHSGTEAFTITGSQARVNSNHCLGWSSGGSRNSAIDTGMSRNAAGVVEFNNGTAGQFRDLKLRSVIQQPPASITPSSNGDLVFEATSNTSVTVKLKGSDGTVRTAVLTLS